MTDNSKDKDLFKRQCPRLGGLVQFDYCMTCGEDMPVCWKVIDCWWEYFDIMGYLKRNLPEDDVTRLVNARPKPKIASLVELIAQAEKRTKS